jgi:4-diphosphocytidyl-2-C-methyl-D-erythritol kinase
VKSVSVRSCAKVNLDLRVLGRREDGYHEIKTVLQTVDLADDLIAEPADRFSLSVTGPHAAGVPEDESNLVLKAARLLAARFPGHGARLRLRKAIPAGSGLGGGSSNAAAALMALDRLWGAQADPGLLYALARSLGADVPFFLFGGTCLGLGRGDEIAPMPDAPERLVAILWPGESLSTRAVYEGLPLSLTRQQILSSMKGFHPGTPTPETQAPDLAPGPDPFLVPVNDLEQTAFGMMPKLARLKERLQASEALAVAMSGSGSALFALYPVTRDPAGLAATLAEGEGELLICRTLSREAYHNNLFERSRT